MMKLEKIELIEHLPQVGAKKYPFEIVSDRLVLYSLNNTKLHNKIIDFIIDDNYNIKFGKGHYKLNEKNTTLRMAGEIMINNDGKVIELNNFSGHYQPSRNLFQYFIDNMPNSYRKILHDDCIILIKDW